MISDKEKVLFLALLSSNYNQQHLSLSSSYMIEKDPYFGDMIFIADPHKTIESLSSNFGISKKQLNNYIHKWCKKDIAGYYDYTERKPYFIVKEGNQRPKKIGIFDREVVALYGYSYKLWVHHSMLCLYPDRFKNELKNIYTSFYPDGFKKLKNMLNSDREDLQYYFYRLLLRIIDENLMKWRYDFYGPFGYFNVDNHA